MRASLLLSRLLAPARVNILFSKAKIPLAILSARKVANVSDSILFASFCNNKTPATVMPRLSFSTTPLSCKQLLENNKETVKDCFQEFVRSVLKKYALVRKQAIQTSIHSHENIAPAKIARSTTMMLRRMKAIAMPTCTFGDSGFILLSKLIYM